MIRPKSRIAIILFFYIFICVALVYAQDQETDLGNLRDSAPKVFIDCRGCDRDYFRDNITYVNYVRDRKDADVHVLITQQSTGGGGREYTFAFIGQKECADVKHTLICTSTPNDSRDEIRRTQLEILERGSTDAAAMQLVRAGVPAGCLSIPCRHVHTSSEMVDEEDVENSVRLLLEVLRVP